MRQRIVRFFCLLFLTLCAAMIALWVRTQFAADEIVYCIATRPAKVQFIGSTAISYHVLTGRNEIGFIRTYDFPGTAGPWSWASASPGSIPIPMPLRKLGFCAGGWQAGKTLSAWTLDANGNPIQTTDPAIVKSTDESRLRYLFVPLWFGGTFRHSACFRVASVTSASATCREKMRSLRI